jgi:hypothetical protein
MTTVRRVPCGRLCDEISDIVVMTARSVPYGRHCDEIEL